MSLIFMKRTWASVALSLVLLTGLSACSGLQRSTGSLPEAATLEALPLIKVGQAKPAQGDYIVFLPASELVTATAKVQGTLFEKTDSKDLQVKLKKDLYLYKNWVSFDRQKWVKDTDAIGGNVRVTLPGWDHPQAGEVLIELNTRH